MLKYFFPILLLLFLSVPVWSTNFPVTTTNTSTAWSTARSSVRPGDTITLAPGLYSSLSTPSTNLAAFSLPIDGTAEQRIVVRAEQKGTVTVRPIGEWCMVVKKYWTWENITFDDTPTTHVFHVKAGGAFLVVRNCHFSNLTEAPIKMSSEPNVSHPDHLLFENNESERVVGVYNSENLNGMNINGCAYGVARGNYFHDISKDADTAFYCCNGSYGGFFKGGALYCIMENNIAKNINGMGVSIGGGTTGQQFFREGTWPYEGRGCIVRNNVIIGYPNRNYGNRAITLNLASECLVYNNTMVNAITASIQGMPYIIDTATNKVAWTGCWNVIFNNLTVNMFYADSIWSPSYPGLLVDGIHYIYYGKFGIDASNRNILRRNYPFHNLRVEVPDINEIFWDTSKNDYRLKPAATKYGIIGTGMYADSATIHAHLDTAGRGGYVDSALWKGLVGAMTDRLGNARPNPPSMGAYEAYDSENNLTNPLATAIENSPKVRNMVRLDGIWALTSPNPASRGITFRYHVPNNLDHLEITVWDTRGRMVFNLYHGEHNAGTYTRQWNGMDHEKRLLPSGTYFLRFRSKTEQYQTKFMIVR